MNQTQETSRIAFYDIKPQVGERQKRVLEALSTFGAMTNSEIGEKLGWPINTVTPRTNELVKKKLVREFDRRHCTVTGRQAIVWGRVTDTLF